jgi:hypothetical protein
LVSNVVDHAGTRCELTVGVDGEGVRIEVRDYYRCPPPVGCHKSGLGR